MARKPAAKPGKRKPARRPKPEPKTLTEKQGAFALRYLVHHNATRAAIEAGFSEKTAAVQGYQLLQNPLVRAEIDRLHAEQAERLKIDADQLLRRLVEDLDADIADLHYADGGLKPIDEWPMAFRKGLVAGVEIEEEYDDDDTEEEFEEQAHGGALKRERKPRRAIGRVVKYRLTDRNRTKDLIGRHRTVQAWKDVKTHEASDALLELYQQIAGKAVAPVAAATPAVDGDGR
jgi:phage terminase small subunit